MEIQPRLRHRIDLQGRRLSILTAAFLGFSSALFSQPPSPPTLQQILERLEANLHHDDTTLPSLFCDEHAVSEVWPSAPDENTATDSVFRLTRTPQPNHTTGFVESREVRKVNGKPATAAHIDGPTLLTGAFEGGLALVSLTQSACMTYALQPIKKGRPADPYIIRFATALTRRNAANCLLQENTTGRAFIDPASMQITRLELTTPRHVIAPGDYDTPPLIGKRTLTVDYAPVQLGGETYWMPSTIAMRTTSRSGLRTTVWSFQATYRNYHKLEVTTRILAGAASPP